MSDSAERRRCYVEWRLFEWGERRHEIGSPPSPPSLTGRMLDEAETGIRNRPGYRTGLTVPERYAAVQSRVKTVEWAVRELSGSLSRPQRRLIVLRYLYGIHSKSELARRLNVDRNYLRGMLDPILDQAYKLLNVSERAAG